MKIKIPRWFDQAMTWCAFHFLPPPRPIGIKIKGYAVTWTDVTVVVYCVAGATALYLWNGDWRWYPQMVFSMLLAWVLFGKDDNEKKDDDDSRGPGRHDDGGHG